MQRYARQAYELGVRYIGGCCKFQSYHIRALAEELREERGRLPAASRKHELWGGGLLLHTKPWVRARAGEQYWSRLNPASGRPYSPALSRPDNWGTTAGDGELHGDGKTVSNGNGNGSDRKAMGNGNGNGNGNGS